MTPGTGSNEALGITRVGGLGTRQDGSAQRYFCILPSPRRVVATAPPWWTSRRCRTSRTCPAQRDRPKPPVAAPRTRGHARLGVTVRRGEAARAIVASCDIGLLALHPDETVNYVHSIEWYDQNGQHRCLPSTARVLITRPRGVNPLGTTSSTIIGHARACDQGRQDRRPPLRPRSPPPLHGHTTPGSAQLS